MVGVFPATHASCEPDDDIDCPFSPTVSTVFSATNVIALPSASTPVSVNAAPASWSSDEGVSFFPIVISEISSFTAIVLFVNSFTLPSSSTVNVVSAVSI